jgi:hypothetical protein
VRRLDGSLAGRTTYAPPLAHPEQVGTEFALFPAAPLERERSSPREGWSVRSR